MSVLSTHRASWSRSSLPFSNRWARSSPVIEPAEGAPAAAELEAQLREFAEKNLASYKRPKSYDFITEMPRDPSGKLFKRRLRDPYWEGAQRAI